ncbi:hypothetical protein TcCL_ESM08074, partial [Trypanosoma cruzi]
MPSAFPPSAIATGAGIRSRRRLSHLSIHTTCGRSRFCWGLCDPAAPGSAGWRRSSLPAPTTCTEACPSSMGRQMPPSTWSALEFHGPMVEGNGRYETLELLN